MLAALLKAAQRPTDAGSEPHPLAAPEAPPVSGLKLNAGQINAVRLALGAEMRDWLDEPELLTRPAALMSEDELNEIRLAAHHALTNAAPIVRSYTADQGSGPYPVWIAGIEGVYLLIASGHDTLGPFGTLADAVAAMDWRHGQFLVGD